VLDYQCGEEEISVEGLIEEQRRFSVSKNPFERVVGSLLASALLKQRLSALTDVALAQLMFHYVWNGMNVFSPELTICEVATERLLRRPVQAGKEDELGGQMITMVWKRELFIGSLNDAEHLASANPMKIAAVLSLCREQIERKSETIHYLRIPIADAQPISTRQFEEIMAAIEQGLGQGNLLIHCVAGFSRSPIMAAAWMHRCGYLNFEAALEEIGSLRPSIDPSPILLKSVMEELSR
jgi:atypical dual specificity phosphatase